MASKGLAVVGFSKRLVLVLMSLSCSPSSITLIVIVGGRSLRQRFHNHVADGMLGKAWLVFTDIKYIKHGVSALDNSIRFI